MPETHAISFSEKRYDDFSNPFIFVLNAIDANDKKFQFQFRCLQDKAKKINFEKLKEYLRINTTTIPNKKRILLYPDYKPAQMDKAKRAQELFKLFPEIQHAEFIYNKILYRKNQEEIKSQNFINFFKIFSFQKNNIQLGYEILETPPENSSPLLCMQLFSNKQISKKIYLFPTSSKSLMNTVSIIKNNAELDLKNLGPTFVEYLPSKSSINYDREIQIRISLQFIISEVLIHLEKSKCFRKDGSKKAEIFRNLAKSIANNEELNIISRKFNEHDTWKLLAQHRDPWSFLSFFKGKTHSLIAWQALRDEIYNFSNPTNTQAMLN